MKNPRLKRYLERKDAKTNQDFQGFAGDKPRADIINPKNKTEKKVAAINVKDGEKRLKDDKETDNGSGGAFEGTEEVKS